MYLLGATRQIHGYPDKSCMVRRKLSTTTACTAYLQRQEGHVEGPGLQHRRSPGGVMPIAAAAHHPPLLNHPLSDPVPIPARWTFFISEEKSL
jgi:hypothetical protein